MTQVFVVTENNLGKGLVINAQTLEIKADEATISFDPEGRLIVSNQFEVLESYEHTDTDTHYYESSTKYLKHIQTGAVWSAEVGQMKERAAPRNEELTSESMQAYDVGVIREEIRFKYDPRSSISGQLLDLTVVTIPVAEYTNAKEFNTSNKTHPFMSKEYFADNLEGKPKILATEFNLPYPTLKYLEGRIEPRITNKGSLIQFGLRTDVDQLKGTEYGDIQVQLNKQVEIAYHIVTTEDETIQGTTSINSDNGYLTLSSISELGEKSIKTAHFEIQPFILEGFQYKIEVAPVALEQLV